MRIAFHSGEAALRCGINEKEDKLGSFTKKALQIQLDRSDSSQSTAACFRHPHGTQMQGNAYTCSARAEFASHSLGCRFIEKEELLSSLALCLRTKCYPLVSQACATSANISMLVSFSTNVHLVAYPGVSWATDGADSSLLASYGGEIVWKNPARQLGGSPAPATGRID